MPAACMRVCCAAAPVAMGAGRCWRITVKATSRQLCPGFVKVIHTLAGHQAGGTAVCAFLTSAEGSLPAFSLCTVNDLGSSGGSCSSSNFLAPVLHDILRVPRDACHHIIKLVTHDSACQPSFLTVQAVINGDECPAVRAAAASFVCMAMVESATTALIDLDPGTPTHFMAPPS